MTSLVIRKSDPYDEKSPTFYPVLIVGAGLSGVALGCQLKEKLGFDQFRIFDRQAGIGGTWWINRYPGVACDVPAVFYSYSFSPNYKWTTFHPPGQEIVQYIEDVCEKYRILDKIQLNTDVACAKWLEDEEVWEVTLTHLRQGIGDLSSRDRALFVEKHGEENVYLRTEIVKAKVLASAVGVLVEPKAMPDNIQGRREFEGKIFHSARWDYGVSLEDKNVVVVGTGCSAAQFVPRLTKPPFNARKVTQLMRSPPWVVPRPEPPCSKDTWEKWSPTVMSAFPPLAWLLRGFCFLIGEYDWRLFGGKEYHARERAKLEGELIKHLKSTVPERYQEILTPDYGVGCKRRIFDAHWFPGLQDPKIELSTLPLTSIQAREVTLGPGRTYPDPAKEDSLVPKEEIQIPADVIVMANGFEADGWLHPLKIQGRGGRFLDDVWAERGGAQAYKGAAMDGFPNFLLIFGPNTATGHSSVLLATENMVVHALKIMKPILNGEVDVVDVKKEAELAWTLEVQEQLPKTVFAKGGCQSWYQNAEGWNSTTYPFSQFYFMYRCFRADWHDWNVKYTTRGLRLKRSRRAMRLAIFILAFVGLLRMRQAGHEALQMPSLLLKYGAEQLAKGLDLGAQSLREYLT